MLLPTDKPFDLALTLECGQGHRWLRDGANPGWYEGVLGTDVVRIGQPDGRDGTVYFECNDDVTDMGFRLHRHFRLSDPIITIYRDLIGRDDIMAALIKLYQGLRVMRIEPWECLAFFMLFRGGRSRITNVMRKMEMLANTFGEPLALNDSLRHRFPTPNNLAGANQGIRDLKLGVPNIHDSLPDVARRVENAIQGNPDGNLDLNGMKRMDYPCAIRHLTMVWTHSRKGPNCVALCSLDKLTAFPIDAHVHRALNDLYWNEPRFPQIKPPKGGLRVGQYCRLLGWVLPRFGPYAGYASQFLFVHDYMSRLHSLKHHAG